MNRFLRCFILCLAIVPLARPAMAGRSCVGMTQTETNFCVKQNWQIADDELNRLWRQVKPIADARGTGKALLAEQRAWLARRDATCEPELNSGGSAAQMFYWACMENMTLRRNDVLRGLR